MADVQMISPPVYIYSDHGIHSVYGWYTPGSEIQPIVGNPDGPGVGPWRVYYGEDPWTMSPA